MIFLFLTHKNGGIYSIPSSTLLILNSVKIIMHKIKNICQKIKNLYRGKQTDYSVGQMIGQDYNNRKRGIKQKPILPLFNTPLIARILNPICRFFRRNLKWIIGTLIAFAILVVMILDYIYK